MKVRAKGIRTVVQPAWIGVSTIVTLVSGALTSIGYNLQEGAVAAALPATLVIFCVGMSSVLAQILISVHLCNENLECLRADAEGIFPPNNAEQVQNDLKKFLNDANTDVKTMKIICYGTGGYDNIIDDIAGGKFIHKIGLDVLVCPPELVLNQRDADTISSVAAQSHGNDNIHFFYAKENPTIRACIAYNSHGEPVWSCLQTYFFNAGHFPSVLYRECYAIVGTVNDNHSFILENNTKIIEEEFRRLKGNEVK
ncbi:MAG: hypothetical protein LIO75_08525 [Lachnospiraceae bacterium]|nr:hypothetical protein [Lachnospiraceae bacterium]